jgi:hypothetical protein
MRALLDDPTVLEHNDQIWIIKRVRHASEYKKDYGNLPASTTVRRRCAMKMLVRAQSRSVALIFFMSSASVCASSADVYVTITLHISTSRELVVFRESIVPLHQRIK